MNSGEFITLYREDGTIFYKGEFKDGKPHGQGTWYNKDGTIEHEGEWKNDKQHVKGILCNKDGTILYKGKFKDGKPIQAKRKGLFTKLFKRG